MLRGFLSDEHQEAFEAGRQMVRRGGGAARICGARTKGGAACQSAPLKGHWRCLRHAGPKAARELRNRQLRDLALGRLSVAAFAKLEARRATNQVRIRWRRDPWAEGATIDLGNHERAFRAAVGSLLHRAPPAELDRARWKFRRFQLDSSNQRAWADVLQGLPARIAAFPAAPLAPTASSVGLSLAPEWAGEQSMSTEDWRLSLDLHWLRGSNASTRERAAAFEAAKAIVQPEADAAAWGRWIEFVRRFGHL